MNTINMINYIMINIAKQTNIETARQAGAPGLAAPLYYIIVYNLLIYSIYYMIMYCTILNLT